MDEGLRRWKPAMWIAVASVVVVGAFVAFAGRTPSTPPAPSSSASSAESAPPPPASVPSSAVAPPPSTATTVVATAPAPTPSASFDPSQPLSPPAPPDSNTPVASVTQSNLPDTPAFKLEATQKLIRDVTARADALDAEIAQLEKEGKTKEAMPKKVMVQHLRQQLAQMQKDEDVIKSEIADAGGDGG